MSTEETKKATKTNKLEMRMEHEVVSIVNSDSLFRHFRTQTILNANQQGISQNKTHVQNTKDFYFFLKKRNAEAV